MLRDRRVSRVGAGRMVWGPLLAMVLSACGSDGSEPAQRAPNDLALAQCELIDGTVLGEPMDPIVLDGVPTQACRITAGHVPGGSRTNLKWSHRYEPLVWILDGTLEIGDNRTYASVEEFVNDEFASLDTTSVSGGSGVLRATAGSVIVVHRNGYFNGDVMPLDETLGGSGEWGGVVVNSIGPHPDCPADTGANRFCNVEGTYGYYAGLSALDAETAVIGEAITGGRRGPPRLGFNGSVSGGGGVVEGAQARAAVVLNAPQSQRSRTTITVFDSGATGVDINGGHTGTALRLVTRNTRGAAVHWHGDFSGGVSGIFYHDQAEAPALHGIGGKVELNGVTLIDRDFKAGTAISVQGGRIDLTNVVVQNFRHCLQLDAGAGAGFAGVAFGCLEPTLAAADGIDHAAGATGAAREDPERAYYEADPGLTADLRVGNPQLVYEAWPFASGGLAVISSVQNHAGRDLRLIYPDCMGVGTLLPEDQVLVVRRETYRICELSGTVDANVRLYSHFNGGRFAWVLNGEVSLGADFAALEEAERLAALESPHYVFMPQGTVVYARANAGLTVQPGMQWYVDGTADHPVEIAALPGDEPANWGGVRIHGVDRAGCQTGERDALCVHAAQPRVRIEYLRLLQAGNGRAALQLYQVGPGARIDHLEIAASASNGLEVHGGRANLKHLLLTHNVGDQLVWQDGWRGTIQHGLFTSGAASTGQVLRGRNHSVDHDATPRSRPTLANLTMVGQGTGSAILLEQGSGLLLYNSIVSAFGTCFDIDDAATAALQSGTPQDIAMFDVVLNCTEALADDDEAGGFDYGYATTHSSGVHELDPQLDQNFVATSAALPAPAGRLNLNPVGDAARYLDDRAGHWGAVSGAEHGWYLGWSGVGVLLSPECDGKGTLVDDYRYPFWVSVTQPAGWATRIELDYKVCRLPASISEDLELTRYTGADKQVNADGYVVVTESGAPYGVPGEVTWMHLPVPTIWLLDGVVTVGDGAAELVGTEEVSTLKADPVELTLQPGTLVMAAERGGLHITRGGRLRIRGEPMLEQEHCSAADAFSRRCRAATTGPVSIFGVPDEGLPMLSPAYLQADRIIRITGTYLLTGSGPPGRVS